MKISEMENYHDAFTDLEAKIKIMLAEREFPGVFSVCVKSFPSIVPASQFRKKRDIQPEMPALLAFEVICKYAPIFFEHNSMLLMLEFVKSTRQLAKHENGYLKKIESALENEEIARLLWNSLEKHPCSTQSEICSSIEASLATMVEILTLWEKFGVVIRPDKKNIRKMNLKTRLNTVIEGICPNCGVLRNRIKEEFFQPRCCKYCGYYGFYHILYEK
jgi:hypothetical protein